MLDFILEFLKKIGVPYISRLNIGAIFNLINQNDQNNNISRILSMYEDKDFDYQYVVNEWRCFTKNIVPCSYESDAVLIILLCKKLMELYKKYNLSETLYWNTVKDIKFKIKECEMVKRASGIFVSEWYEKFFRLELFGFGRLQFELCHVNFDEKELEKYDFALHVHIPRDETPLDENECEKSISNAFEFFKDKFKKDKLLFLCDSWILWPGNKEFVKPNSNIAKFANRFTLLRTRLNDDYSELWRIFDREYTVPKCLIGDTSLRKGYINLVNTNTKIGSSLGYFER